MSGPWRDPPEETVGLFPGFTVDERRRGGTIGLTGGPILSWFVANMLHLGAEGAADWDVDGAQVTQIASLVYCLLLSEGEFARLLLVVANAERCEQRSMCSPPWWETKRHRQRVAGQLRRCLQALEDE